MKKSTFLLSSSNGPWNMTKSRMNSQPSTFPCTSLISSSSSAERTDIDLRIEQMKRTISSTTTYQLTLGKKLMQIIPCNNATFSSLNWKVLVTWHKNKLIKRDTLVFFHWNLVTLGPWPAPIIYVPPFLLNSQDILRWDGYWLHLEPTQADGLCLRSL